MVEVTLKSRRFSLFSITQPVWDTIKSELKRLTGANLLKTKEKPENLSEISLNLTPDQFSLLKSKKIFVENAEIAFEVQEEQVQPSPLEKQNTDPLNQFNSQPDSARPFEKRVEKKGSRLINKRKVYISNIPAFITDELITSIFEQFGAVRNAYVCSSKRKGKFLYGFASFYEEDAVIRCLRYGVVSYKGYKMNVKMASERPETVSTKAKEVRTQPPMFNSLNFYNQNMLFYNPLGAMISSLANTQTPPQLQSNLAVVAPVRNPEPRWAYSTNHYQRKSMNPYDRDKLKKKNYIRIGSKLLSKCEENHCLVNLRINEGKLPGRKKNKRRKVLRKSEDKFNNKPIEHLDNKLKETLSYFC